MKLKAYWKQTSHGDCKQKPTNKKKKTHNRRKTRGINKQTNKHIYKIKTNKRTSSIGYEKTVFSYQQSVAPGPPNQTYPTYQQRRSECPDPRRSSSTAGDEPTLARPYSQPHSQGAQDKQLKDYSTGP